jgi:tetratricopeptide (TPR) repeat protein
MYVRPSRPVMLLFAMWATSLVTMNGGITREGPEELATLLPAISSDRQTAIEIRAHFKNREFAEAAHLSDALMQSHPRSREGYFWKGVAAIHQREFYPAVRNLKAAEKLEAPYDAVAENLAMVYYLLDHQQLLEIKMKEAIAPDPGDFAPHYYLGRYHLSSTTFEAAGALDRSEAYGKRALDLSESRHVSPQLTCDNLRRKIRSRAYAALGLVAMKRGALPLAAQEFERTVAENPDADGLRLYRLAKLYLTSGRRAHSAALFQKAFQASPQEISSLAAAELSRER